MNELVMYTVHLFAGAGGGLLGDLLLGHTPIGACEIEDYPRRVLLQRQLDGILPVFPIWDDVTTLRSDNPECAEAFARWKTVRDQLIICGGFPCTDISVAGKGAGIDGECSGLWREQARIISEVRPRFAFVENSPALTTRGGLRVIGDLTEMGYDCRWGIMGADTVGCCHHRARIWICADSNRIGLQGWRKEWQRQRVQTLVKAQAWGDLSQPPTCGRNDVVAYRMERSKAIGNGQVPACVKLAFETLTNQP